jgi:prevent-host-death family protein
MIRQTSVGAFEAKTHFSQLIERTLHGEEIFITRRGKTVAKLVPVNEPHNSESMKEAIKRLRALAEEMNLGPFDWEEWKNYRDIGRRS